MKKLLGVGLFAAGIIAGCGISSNIETASSAQNGKLFEQMSKQLLDKTWFYELKHRDTGEIFIFTRDTNAGYTTMNQFSQNKCTREAE